MTDESLILRNKKQIEEALSDMNRYYFWKNRGREPFDNTELILFYIEQGGARDFAQKQKGKR